MLDFVQSFQDAHISSKKKKWGGASSAWILVQSVAQTFKLSREAILQVSEDPYHTEIQALSGKFHNINFLTLPEV